MHEALPDWRIVPEFKQINTFASVLHPGQPFLFVALHTGTVKTQGFRGSLDPDLNRIQAAGAPLTDHALSSQPEDLCIC